MILFVVFSFGKMRKNIEKQLFFHAAMARLGKNRTGAMAGLGSIGITNQAGVYIITKRPIQLTDK